MAFFFPFGGILIGAIGPDVVWELSIPLFVLSAFVRAVVAIVVLLARHFCCALLQASLWIWELQIPVLAQLSASLFAVAGLTIQCGPEESQAG